MASLDQALLEHLKYESHGALFTDETAQLPEPLPSGLTNFVVTGG